MSCSLHASLCIGQSFENADGETNQLRRLQGQGGTRIRMGIMGMNHEQEGSNMELYGLESSSHTWNSPWVHESPVESFVNDAPHVGRFGSHGESSTIAMGHGLTPSLVGGLNPSEKY